MRPLLALALASLTLAPSSSLALRRPAAPLAASPTRGDIVRAHVALVAALRHCLGDDGWSLRADLAFDPHTGRIHATAPDGVTWSAQEQRCLTQATAHVHGPRFTDPSFSTLAVLEGRDPRSDLLAAVDVAACIPNFDPCSCHLNVGVSMNARRPTVVSAVTFDVQGCVPDPTQLQCVEAAITHTAFPADARDTGGFRGPVGPMCGG